MVLTSPAALVVPVGVPKVPSPGSTDQLTDAPSMGVLAGPGPVTRTTSGLVSCVFTTPVWPPPDTSPICGEPRSAVLIATVSSALSSTLLAVPS